MRLDRPIYLPPAPRRTPWLLRLAFWLAVIAIGGVLVTGALIGVQELAAALGPGGLANPIWP